MAKLPTPMDPDDQPTGKHLRGRNLARAERDAEAARLRGIGYSYRQIGDILGIDHSTAADAVSRALRAVPLQSVTELRKIENAKMDGYERDLCAIVADPPRIVAANGTVTAQPDSRVAVGALGELIKLSARRARLNGLDAPTRTIREVQADESLNDQIRAALAQIETQMMQAQAPPPMLAGALDDDDLQAG